MPLSDLPPGFELIPDQGGGQLPAQPPPERPSWVDPASPSWLPAPRQELPGTTPAPAPAAAPAPAPEAAGGLPPGFELLPSDTGINTSNVIRAATQDTGIPGIGTAFNYLAGGAEAAQTGMRKALGWDPLHPEYSQAAGFLQRTRENAAREAAQGKAFSEAHPIVSMVAGTVGGVGALAPAAATGIGARLLGLTGGSLPGRIGMSAGTFGLMGAGSALEQGTDPVTGAAIGAGAGALGPVAGKYLGAGVNKLGEMISAPAVRAATEKAAQSLAGGPAGAALTEGGTFTHEALRDIARQGYGAIDNAGAQIHPNHVADSVNQIFSDLRANNFNPQDQPGVFGRLGRLMQTEPVPPAAPTVGPSVPNLGQIPSAPTMRPAPTSFGDIAAARMKLNDIIRKSPGTSKAAAAEQAKEGLDRLLETITHKDVVSGDPTLALKQLQEANANYRFSKRAELYDEAIRKAQLQASSSGVGGNLDNALRQQFKALRNNKRAMLGATAEEKAAIDKIVSGGFSQNIARMLGRLSPFGHSLPMMGGLAVGIAAGEPMTALGIGVGAHVAKHISDAMTRGRATALSAAIRRQAPASRTLQGKLPPPRSPVALQRNAQILGAALRAQQIEDLTSNPRRP